MSVKNKLKALCKEYFSFDFIVLALLFGFVLLPTLQLILPWIKDYRVRELLYFIMYMKVALSTNITSIHEKERPILIFMILAIIIAINTQFRYGAEYGLACYARFMNCALIAPIVGRANITPKHLKAILLLWIAALIFSSGTMLYQFGGGEIEWISQGIQGQRGGLNRYVSIMGYNAGAISSTAALPYLMICSKYVPFVIISIFFLLALIILSLSKAAIVGFFVSIFLTYKIKISHYNFNNIVRVRLRPLSVVIPVCMLVVVFGYRDIIAIDYEKISSIAEYMLASKELITGTDEKIYFTNRSNNIVDDFIYRIEETRDTMVKISKEPYWSPVDYVFGSSFAVAGSAALEERNYEFPSESTLSQLFISGGIVFLVAFVWLWQQTFSWLWKHNLDNPLGQSCAVGFLVISIFLLTSAVIYDPGTGAYYWFLIGASANPKLQKLGY